MYIGGEGLQGMGILADRSSPFQLGALAGIDPALSEILRWMESVTGIVAGTTYSNGVYGGGDPTVFGMSASPSLDEAQATKQAIYGIGNRDPQAMVAGLSSSNAFIRKIAMAQIVSVFDNGMGGGGQGYAIYLQAPASVQGAIKAAWLAANGGGANAQAAWFRIVEQPRMDALLNELFSKTNFGLGSPFRVENGTTVRDLVTGQVVGDLSSPSFNIDALAASVKVRELARVAASIAAGQTTADQAAQSQANTKSEAPPPPPSTARQNAPVYYAPGATTPSAMPASLPKNVPATTPAEVKAKIIEATDQGGNIPRDTGFTSVPPVTTDGGGNGATRIPPVTGIIDTLPPETAVPAGGGQPVNVAPSGLDALTPDQKKLALVGAGVVAFFLLRHKGS